MATILQQKNGRWQAIIRRAGPPAQSMTFELKVDAEGWARKIESETERGLWRDTTAAERVTLSRLLDEYESKVLPGLRGHGYKTALSHLRDGLGGIALARLSPADIARYRDKRLEAVSADTVRKELGVLSKLIDLAVMEWGYMLPANPCKLVKKPTPSKARDRLLSADETEWLWASLAQSKSPYMLPFCRFTVETAMRPGEILRLDWRHVDLKRRTATCRRQKMMSRARCRYQVLRFRSWWACLTRARTTSRYASLSGRFSRYPNRLLPRPGGMQ